MQCLQPVVLTRAADDLRPGDAFAGSNQRFVEVRVGRAQSPTMSDGHREHPGDISRKCDVAAISRPDRGPAPSGNVDPPVTGVAPYRGVATHHRSRHRHGETCAVERRDEARKGNG